MKAYIISLTGVRHEMKAYDEGFPGDPAWVVVDSLGPIGAVRAASESDAWGVALDMFLPDPIDDDDIWENKDEGTLAEGYEWRPNGTPTDDTGLKSPVASIDLNGCRVFTVGEYMRLASHSIEIEFETEEEEE